jgi:hypothetical protein
MHPERGRKKRRRLIDSSPVRAGNHPEWNSMELTQRCFETKLA